MMIFVRFFYRAIAAAFRLRTLLSQRTKWSTENAHALAQLVCTKVVN